MTQAKLAEKYILIDLEKAPSIFDYIENGVTITDKNATILYTNPAFSKITGYSKTEARGDNPGILHSGRHHKTFYQEMWNKIMTQGFWEGEIWNRRKSGEIYPEYLTISKIPQGNEENYLFIAIFSDLSYLKKDIKKQLHLAFYDPLTKLPNRNLYLDRVRQSVEATRDRNTEPLAIFYMDLDKFKAVNDTYGHIVGDELLNKVGKRLSSIVREGDTIARMGGDEFTAILKGVNTELSATRFAERILKSIEKPFLIDRHKIEVSISIGISFFPIDAHTVENLLTYADSAMYQAKKSGTKIIYYEANESPSESKK